MDKILIMISNYLHDLSVAMLASNILAVYFVGRFLDRNPIAEQIIPALFTKLARVTYVVLAYVLLAGAIRAYFFMDFEWNPAAGRGQVAALIVKHVLLISVTIFGIVLHRKYQKKYGVNR